MKKKAKMLIIGVLTFFIGMVPALAKNMNISELETKAEELKSGISDIYVIGEYAFTSDHELTTQDVMLAAKSIKVEDVNGKTDKNDIYGEMTISHIQRTRDASFQYGAWSIVAPKVGTKSIQDGDTLDIHYIDYIIVPEDTIFTVSTDLEGKTDYTDVLKSALSFEASKAYENGKLENKDGKLTGLLLKNEEITLNNEDKAKYNNPVYFFAYVLEIEGADKNTTIKVDGINGPGEILWKDFDVTPEKDGCENKTPGIVVLVPVDPEKLSQNPKIIITIDKDGEGKEYAPETKELDLSGLRLQQESKVTIDLNKATDTDKETMKGWGYRSELNQDLNLDNEGNLEGTLVKQSLNDNVFKDKEGYYFDFTFVTPDGVSKENVKIKHVSKDGQLIKEFTKGAFDDQNNLTILYQFASTQTNCTGDDCKLYYTVDFDGDGNEYFPTTYVIDYSKVKFEKSSEFTISKVEDDKADSDNKESWKGWDKPESYKTEFTSSEEDPLVVKVTGLIPIDTDAFDEDSDPFTGDEYGYYLAFKLTKKEGSTSDKMNVKFLQGDGHEDKTEVITNTDFGNGNELYVLKYINANDNNSGKKKQFDVVVDLDGDGEDYAPYTITIDWSELDFQNESLFTDAKIASKDAKEGEDGYISETDKSQITGWGYEFEKDGEDLKLDNYQLTGKVKEQSVNAGFNSNDGYYVPIKIYGPSEEQIEDSHYLKSDPENSKKWTVELNTEDGSKKTVIPSEEDYNNGFITVLFKLKNDSGDKKITYKIDFDGEGDYFLPYEETINYGTLDFLSKNTITYKYTDKDGKAKTITETVYEGEQIPNKELTEEQSDYRKLDGWYNKTEKVEPTTTSKEDEDLELEAHWNLNVEKFIEDVVTDLNNPDSTYSDDFSSQFELVQGTENKNEITIKVKSPNVSLSKLSETSIPGTIAYILQKGEIKDVTLSVNGSTPTTFDKNIVSAVGASVTGDSALDETGEAIKAKVIEEAKKAFDTELQKLSGTEEDATMDQVEFEGTKFTLKVGEAANDTVKLVDDSGEDLAGKDTYTFKFDSDFAVIDQNDELGPNSIKEAIDKNSYDTIYIDGDLTEAKMVEITATKDVTIEPIENFSKTSGLMAAAEGPERTITVSNGQNYAIDVKAGNGIVTLSDLKVTGGKFGEIKIEQGATVTANNIDVSGKIEPSQKSADADDMHASILVDGILTANNVKNSDETYETPTIALVTSYSYPEENVRGEDQDTGASGNVHPAAKVKVPENSGMSKNGKYYIVKQNAATVNDKIEESYYGSFYYVKNENSQIYFMTLIDRDKYSSGSGIDLFKIYKYNDTIDIKSLGYESGKSQSKDETKVFDKFVVTQVGSSTQVNKEFSENTSVQNVLQSHVTNQIVAKYKSKPVSALTVAKINGLSNKNNNLSGTLTTQDKSGKYNIPVTIASDKFEEGVSTVDVVDPNGAVKTYTYSSSKAKETSQKTMNINLEAIKESRITGENGKVYTIKVDVDGAKDNYKEETYTVDYNDVNTLEEIINKAAQNTHNANSFTVKKNNKINGYTEKFTYEFNKDTGLTHLTSENGDSVEEYSFSLKYVGKTDSKVSVVVEKRTNHEEGKVYINDWEYLHPQQVGTAIHEVSMLTDVMGQTYINAIDKVQKADEKEHTYIVTLNRDKYNDWVKKNYLSNPKYSSAEWALNETVTVEVELDNSDKYIKSIKTSESSSTNTFNVTFSKINATDIKEPKEFLAADGKTLTDAEITDFYNKGLKWWEDYTGATVYSK